MLGAGLSLVRQGRSSAAAPSFVFQDNFNRANENLEASPNWTNLVSGNSYGQVISNNLSCQTTSAGTVYVCPDIGTDNMYVQAKWNFVSGAPAAFLCGRIGGFDNYIGARYNGSTNKVQLYSKVAGTFAHLGANSVSDITAGDTIRLEIDTPNDRARILVNGVEFVTWTTLGHILEGNTKAGVAPRSTLMTNWLDDFEAGAL